MCIGETRNVFCVRYNISQGLKFSHDQKKQTNKRREGTTTVTMFGLQSYIVIRCPKSPCRFGTLLIKLPLLGSDLIYDYCSNKVRCFKKGAKLRDRLKLQSLYLTKHRTAKTYGGGEGRGWFIGTRTPNLDTRMSDCQLQVPSSSAPYYFIWLRRLENRTLSCPCHESNPVPQLRPDCTQAPQWRS